MKLGLSYDEVLYMRVGEIRDLITCMQIENGTMKPVYKVHMSFDEAIKLE